MDIIALIRMLPVCYLAIQVRAREMDHAFREALIQPLIQKSQSLQTLGRAMDDILHKGLYIWLSGRRMIKLFCLTAGGILAITGLSKIWAVVANHAKIFEYSDSIFGLTFKDVMLGSGLLELIVASICFCTKVRHLAPVYIAWLSTCLLVYRLGLWCEGWHLPCSCLGNLTQALHIPPQTADTAMKIILAYLLFGSYATLFLLWRQQKIRKAKERKMNDAVRPETVAGC